MKASAFPVAFDSAKPNEPFLSPDLFDPTGPWVCVTGPRGQSTPIASEHARVFAGRSVFLVFIRLPDGCEATLEYLDKLKTFPKQWKVPPQESSEIRPRPPTPELNLNVPQFPAGTQVALVRQLVVVTDDGKPTPTGVTENVQFRTYREILPPEKDTNLHAKKAQGFVELELRRAELFAKRNGGLRAINENKLAPRALSFFRGWTDPFEAKSEIPYTHHRPEPAIL